MINKGVFLLYLSPDWDRTADKKKYCYTYILSLLLIISFIYKTLYYIIGEYILKGIINMNKKIFLILALLVLLVNNSICWSEDFIQIGDTKKVVLEVLGAPRQVLKYEFLNEEVWEYGLLSSITFKDGKVYEYTGGKNLKIKLTPSNKVEKDVELESITIGSTYDDVIYVLGTPDEIFKYPSLNKEVWGYGLLSSITFRDGRVYEYTGAKELKIKIFPKKQLNNIKDKPISIDFGSTFDEVLYVLGTPDEIFKYPSLDKEVWGYGLLSSITFKNGKVYEYTGGQDLKISINSNGKYFGTDNSNKDKYYSFNGNEYSIKKEGNHYNVSVCPTIPISPIIIKNENSHYKVSDYYGSYNSSVAENGSYYGQISEHTGRPKTVYVRGYFRKDGTYVRSHYRSRPLR